MQQVIAAGSATFGWSGAVCSPARGRDAGGYLNNSGLLDRSRGMVRYDNRATPGTEDASSSAAHLCLPHCSGVKVMKCVARIAQAMYHSILGGVT